MSGHDNNNRAAAFPFRDNMIPILNGRMNIEGRDEYITLVKTETKNGTPIVEVYQKVGSLWPKKDDAKENAPDWNGSIHGKQFYLAMWTREKDGMRYMSGQVQRPQSGNSSTSNQQNYASRDDVDAMADLDDEVPF